MAYYDPFHKNYYYNTDVPCFYPKNVFSPSMSEKSKPKFVDYIYDYESTIVSVTPAPSPFKEISKSNQIHPKIVEYIYEEEEYVPKLRQSHSTNSIPIRESYMVKQKKYDDSENHDSINLNNSFAMRSDSLINPLYPDLIYKNKLYKPVNSISMDDNYIPIEIEEDQEDNYYETSYRSMNDSRENLRDKIKEAKIANKILFDEFKDKLFIERRSRRKQQVSFRHKLKSIFRF